ncbi:hypothetical protein [Actinoplanes sp. NBRC 103695]|uniref:hypothetical protein n=1 Tax=Actinoplanes sp. NBRC 103695 TaxID=3032202 RepID=UPI0024A3A642|nr:hypothetical protein Acsp02_38670 [Actinoplanes sp. NBRC 103695]
MTVPDYTATLPRKRMGAGVLLTHPDGRVLLVEPTYKDHWEVPGGTPDQRGDASSRGRRHGRSGGRPPYFPVNASATAAMSLSPWPASAVRV